MTTRTKTENRQNALWLITFDATFDENQLAKVHAINHTIVRFERNKSKVDLAMRKFVMQLPTSTLNIAVIKRTTLESPAKLQRRNRAA